MGLRGLLVLGLFVIMLGVVSASVVINDAYQGETDKFYSSCAGNDIVNVFVNASDAEEVNVTFAFEIPIDCDGDENISLVYNVTSELWEGSCDVSEEAALSEFEGGAIIIYAINYTDVSFDDTSISSVILYNMTTPPMPEGGCDRFGDDTTNLCEEDDFTDINFIIELETNGTCQSESIEQELPWEDFKKILTLNFSSLDFSDPSIENKLAALSSSINPYITPPGEFGSSYIYVDASIFTELDTSTEITMYGLPFSDEPLISGDEAISAVSYALNDPYIIEIGCDNICDDVGEEMGFDNLTQCIENCTSDSEPFGLFNMTIPNGNLSFTVAGFSQYDITEEEVPTITYNYPTDEQLIIEDIDYSFLVNVTLNGTGSQIGRMIVSVDDNEPLIFEYSDLLADCTNETADWDVLTCALVNVSEMSRGEHTIIVSVEDLSENSAEESIGFIFDIIDCGDTITENLTLVRDLNCSLGDGITLDGDNITLDGNGYTIYGPGPGESYDGIYCEALYGITIKNLTLDGFESGIWCSALNSTFNDNIILNTVYGINADIGFASKEGWIHLTNNEINDTPYGIYVNSYADLVIQDNNLYNTDNGMDVSSSTGTISGNTLNYIEGDAIYVSNSDNLTIQENTITDAFYDGIYVTTSSEGLEISDNSITSTVTDEEGDLAGIYLDVVGYADVTNNNITINDVPGTGIYVKGMGIGSYNNIDNNYVVLGVETSLGGDQYGIYIADDNNNITNNIIECDGDIGEEDESLGLYLDGNGAANVEDNSLSGNEISGCIYGLYADTIYYFHADDEEYSGNRYGAYLLSLGSEETMPLISNSVINDNLRGIWISSSYVNITDTESNSNVGEGLYVDSISTAYVTDGDFEDNGDDGIFSAADSGYVLNWTIEDYAVCRDNNITIYDGELIFDGGILELDNCTLTINGSVISMEGNLTSLDFSESEITENTSTQKNFTNANSTITLYLGGNVTTTLAVSKKTPTASGTTLSLTSVKGIEIYADDSTKGNLTWALIKIFYNQSELDALNIDETTLRIWYYNETLGDWEEEPNQGVNATENYVWANVTHFSLFGVFGALSESEDEEDGTTSSGGCVTSWICSEWSSCIDGIQIRTCEKERTYCYADPSKKPIESQECDEGQLSPIPGTPELIKEKTEEGITTNQIIIIIVLIVAVGAIITIILKKRKQF